MIWRGLKTDWVGNLGTWSFSYRWTRMRMRLVALWNWRSIDAKFCWGCWDNSQAFAYPTGICCNGWLFAKLYQWTKQLIWSSRGLCAGVPLMPLTWKMPDTSVQGGCFITAQTIDNKISGKILLDGKWSSVAQGSKSWLDSGVLNTVDWWGVLGLCLSLPLLRCHYRHKRINKQNLSSGRVKCLKHVLISNVLSRPQ